MKGKSSNHKALRSLSFAFTSFHLSQGRNSAAHFAIKEDSFHAEEEDIIWADRREVLSSPSSSSTQINRERVLCIYCRATASEDEMTELGDARRTSLLLLLLIFIPVVCSDPLAPHYKGRDFYSPSEENFMSITSL